MKNTVVSARSRQKAQTDTRVCRSIRHRESSAVFREATQKVSAVSGRVKKEESDDGRGRGTPSEGREREGGREGKERRNVPCKHGSGCLPQRQ